jgi:hypothetical protein
MPKRERTLFTQAAPEWNIRGLIKRLGGVGPTIEKLMAKGFMPPDVNTVQGWSRRNRVPGDWAPALFAVAQDAGIESPMDMLIRDLSPSEPKDPQP